MTLFKSFFVTVLIFALIAAVALLPDKAFAIIMVCATFGLMWAMVHHEMKRKERP